MEAQLMKKMVKYIDDGESVALVTVTSKLGSGPRDTGSMMLVGASGELIDGTIGGGKVEEQAKMDAAECIRKNESAAFKYELTLKDTEHSLGMACGGAVEIFVKVFSRQDDLVVFGGGHIALELSAFAKTLNYRVTIIDHRPEFISDDRFPNVERKMAMDDFMVEPFEMDSNTSVVIVTHGHSFDMEALKMVIHSPARYIGMIGSRSKINFCFNQLKNEGTEEELLATVHAPIGLDVGGETPPEIALAIMGEIQAVKYNRSGGFLSTKRRPPNDAKSE
jgi:xanthine dehydrogenase accessory factor